MKKVLSLFKNVHQFFHLLVGHPMGRIGLILIILVLIAALFAPYLRLSLIHISEPTRPELVSRMRSSA